MDLTQVIKASLVTEKGTNLNAQKKYLVQVNPSATKIDVKQAVEALYDRKVASIRIILNPPKVRIVARGKSVQKRVRLKKAIITLKKGEKELTFTKSKDKK